MDQELKDFIAKYPDKAAQLINHGVLVGQEHSVPSPQTLKMFEDMKLDIHGHFADFRELVSETLTIAKEARDEAKKTNGKVAELDKWKLRTEGGAAVLKGIWGLAAVYVVGSSIVLLNMWADWRNQDTRIRQIVSEELRSVVLEEQQ